MTIRAVATSRNTRKRAASGDLHDIGRFPDPSFRDGGPDWVKSEEVPVDVFFVPEHSECSSPD
jgi:hypothetical protein